MLWAVMLRSHEMNQCMLGCTCEGQGGSDGTLGVVENMAWSIPKKWNQLKARKQKSVLHFQVEQSTELRKWNSWWQEYT